MDQKEKTIQNISQNALHFCKFKKLDLYSIFRYLTGKHGKRIQFDIDAVVCGVPDLSNKDLEDLKEFINQVNPFFNYQDTVKFDYYKRNYFVALQVYEKCKKVVEEREIVAFYRLKEINSKNLSYMTFYELDDHSGSKTEIAVYKTKEEALIQAEKFLKLYRFLKLEKTLELIAFNSNDEILEKISII